MMPMLRQAGYSAFGVTPDLVKAVMGVESGGRPNAVSPKGAVGLMQIMPSTARGMGITRDALFDPDTNVQAGTQILTRLLQKYRGDLPKVLAAYNAGEGAVDRGQIPASTQKYVSDVLARVGTGMASTGYPQSPFQARPPMAPPPSMLARLQSAWSPGTAQAAEGPPSMADIERDKARRAEKETPTLVNQPKQDPWPVRAAGWLPAIGQTVGEYGAGAADLPLALTGIGAASEPVAMGAGGGLGYGAGELANRGVRSLYGLPNPTWKQEAKDTGVAAGTSALAVPAWRLLGKVLPASLKAGLTVAREQGPSFRAAASAAEETADRLMGKLDITAEKAADIAGKSQWVQQLAQMPKRAGDMLAALDANVRNWSAEKAAAGYSTLRDGISSMIVRAGEGADSEAEKLWRMRQAAAQVPSNVVKRLYNMAPRELTELVDTTLNQHGRWLRRPDLQDSLRRAIEMAPTPLRNYVEHHIGWLYFRGLFNPVSAIKDVLLAKTFTTGSRMMNSPIMRRLYLNLLKAEGPHQVRMLTQALINAAGTHMINSWRNQPTPTEEPEAAPAPAAAPTPTAPPRAPGLPPAAPSSPEESTQEIEPPEPPPGPRDMPAWMSTE